MACRANMNQHFGRACTLGNWNEFYIYTYSICFQIYWIYPKQLREGKGASGPSEVRVSIIFHWPIPPRSLSILHLSFSRISLLSFPRMDRQYRRRGEFGFSSRPKRKSLRTWQSFHKPVIVAWWETTFFKDHVFSYLSFRRLRKICCQNFRFFS